MLDFHMMSNNGNYTKFSIKHLIKSSVLLATLTVIPILIFHSTSFASGWNDYKLDIGDGFSIVRANSLEVVLVSSDNTITLYPGDYEGVGPIVAYSMKKDYIFTKNAGRYKRNLFEGDTFEDIDYDKKFFFIVDKKNENIDGPLTEKQFSFMVQKLGDFKVKWKKPRNPNFLVSLIGTLIFLFMSFFILVWKSYYVFLPILGLGIIVIAVLFKKRRAYHMSSE